MKRVLATCGAVVAFGAVAIVPTASASKTNALRACESGHAARCLGPNVAKGGQACLKAKRAPARCPRPG
jgi:hypothetical protein